MQGASGLLPADALLSSASMPVRFGSRVVLRVSHPGGYRYASVLQPPIGSEEPTFGFGAATSPATAFHIFNVRDLEDRSTVAHGAVSCPVHPWRPLQHAQLAVGSFASPLHFSVRSLLEPWLARRWPFAAPKSPAAG